MPPRKKKPQKSSRLRILIKCSWSGARLPADVTNLSSMSTVNDVISSVSSNLPPVIMRDYSWDDPSQPAIVYMRTNLLKRDWSVTTLNDLLGSEGDGGSIMLTLNLPSATMAATETGTAGNTNELVAPATDNALDASSAATIIAEDEMACNVVESGDEMGAEPMEIDEMNTATGTEEQHLQNEPITKSPDKSSPEHAVQNVLNSNFDTDSTECLKTYLKILDNILSKPNDVKVRMLRITNATVQKKIICKKGGLDVLLSIGFAYEAVTAPVTFDFDNTSSAASKPPPSENIVLSPEHEDRELIVSARNYIASTLIGQLKVPPKEIPPVPTINKVLTLASSRSNSKVPAFDPFKARSFNTQSAAMGAPDPHSIAPDGQKEKSSTQRQLEQLKKKQTMLEQSMQKKLLDRNVVAYLPGETGPIVTLRGSDDVGGSSSSGKGDASLLAGQMKRREEERKKREEGGFTTKAMRDLEKMKKAKVYSHAQLRICFPDGCRVEAKFLPNETIDIVKQQIASLFLPEFQSRFQFDVYVSPPRRLLSETKSLADEGLVPAARINVSWKNGPSELASSSPGSFLQRHFFHAFAASLVSTNFPDSKSLTDNRNASDGSKLSSGKKDGASLDKASREEEMMKRMLGKRKGLLGGKKLGGRGNSKNSSSASSCSKNDGKKSGGSGGKPSWFKG